MIDEVERTRGHRKKALYRFNFRQISGHFPTVHYYHVCVVVVLFSLIDVCPQAFPAGKNNWFGFYLYIGGVLKREGSVRLPSGQRLSRQVHTRLKNIIFSGKDYYGTRCLTRSWPNARRTEIGTVIPVWHIDRIRQMMRTKQQQQQHLLSNRRRQQPTCLEDRSSSLSKSKPSPWWPSRYLLLFFPGTWRLCSVDDPQNERNSGHLFFSPHRNCSRKLAVCSCSGKPF